MPIDISTDMSLAKGVDYNAIWERIINRPVLQELPASAQVLVDNVTRIGYDSAISKQTYRCEILTYLDAWTRENSKDTHSVRKMYTPMKRVVLPDKKDVSIFIAYSSKWAENIYQETTDISRHSAYNTWITQARDSQISKGREHVSMKRYLPISYVMLVVVFLSLSLIFGITFLYGRKIGKFFVGPWTHIMSFLASLGLLITAIVACIEWVKLQNGEK